MKTCKHCGLVQTLEMVGTWCRVKEYNEDFSKKESYWLCGKHYAEMVENRFKEEKHG